MGKKATIVGQEDFWFQACQVKVRGQSRTSEDEPECTNHEKFAATIEENMNTHDVVIAEGFQLVHHPQVTALLDHIYSVELDKNEARCRRIQQRDARLNANPLKEEDFDDLLWPAHERYAKEKVAPLGARVVQLQSPGNTSARDDLVRRIMHGTGLAECHPPTAVDTSDEREVVAQRKSRPRKRDQVTKVVVSGLLTTVGIPFVPSLLAITIGKRVYHRLGVGRAGAA